MVYFYTGYVFESRAQTEKRARWRGLEHTPRQFCGSRGWNLETLCSRWDLCPTKESGKSPSHCWSFTSVLSLWLNWGQGWLAVLGTLDVIILWSKMWNAYWCCSALRLYSYSPLSHLLLFSWKTTKGDWEGTSSKMFVKQSCHKFNSVLKFWSCKSF